MTEITVNRSDVLSFRNLIYHMWEVKYQLFSVSELVVVALFSKPSLTQCYQCAILFQPYTWVYQLCCRQRY